MDPRLIARFPNASRSTLEANAVAVPVVSVTELSSEPKRKTREPNKTEQRFLDILAAQQRRGDIVSYRYEGMALKWGDCMSYCPDAVVIPNEGKWMMIELKGAHIRSRDMVRFKGCRAEWPEFDFAMWQWKSGEWTRLL